MNAADIELRLHDLIAAPKTSDRPIERINVDSRTTVRGLPYAALKAIYLHPDDWEQLLKLYHGPSKQSGKYFFRGIPVYLTDPAEAASLQPMIQDDPRYDAAYEILRPHFVPGSDLPYFLARDILRALDEPQKVDWVGVTFRDFDSPAQASALAKNKAVKIYTYYAPQRMKLTIGDVVEVEDGSRPATVVELNAPHNANLVYKRVLKRDE